jgi:hypothetical protein
VSLPFPCVCHVNSILHRIHTSCFSTRISSTSILLLPRLAEADPFCSVPETPQCQTIRIPNAADLPLPPPHPHRTPLPNVRKATGPTSTSLLPTSLRERRFRRLSSSRPNSNLPLRESRCSTSCPPSTRYPARARAPSRRSLCPYKRPVSRAAPKSRAGRICPTPSGSQSITCWNTSPGEPPPRFLGPRLTKHIWAAVTATTRKPSLHGPLRHPFRRSQFPTARRPRARPLPRRRPSVLQSVWRTPPPASMLPLKARATGVTAGTRKVRLVRVGVTAREWARRRAITKTTTRALGTALECRLFRLLTLSSSPQAQNIVFDVSQPLDEVQASRDAVKSTAIALVKQDPVFLSGTTIGATHWVAYAMTRGKHRDVSFLTHPHLPSRSRSRYFEVQRRPHFTSTASCDFPQLIQRQRHGCLWKSPGRSHL